MLQMRQYRPEDSRAVKELLSVTAPQLDPMGEIRRLFPKISADLDDIEGIYLKNGDYIVGAAADKIIAMGGFRQRTPACAEIKRVRIHPDHQRRGYGETIMRELMKRAAGMGYSEAYLDTLATNTRAQKLFDKLGFKVSGHDQFGGKFEIICYTRELDGGGE
jgi:ribosomal protein S18 acetylase RimI-like enzyme